VIARGQASFFDALTFLLIVSAISAALVLFSTSYGLQAQKALYNTIDLDYTNSLMNALLHAKYETGEKTSGNYPVKEFVIQAVKRELSFVGSSYTKDKLISLNSHTYGETKLKQTLKELMGPVFYQKGLIFLMTDIDKPNDKFVYCLFHETGDNLEYCSDSGFTEIKDISGHISKKENVFSASSLLAIPINKLNTDKDKTPSNTTTKIATFIIDENFREKRHVKMTLMLWDL